MVTVLKEDRQIQDIEKKVIRRRRQEWDLAKECLVAGSQMVGGERISSYTAFKGNPESLPSMISRNFYDLSHLLYGTLSWDPTKKTHQIKKGKQIINIKNQKR